MKFVVLALALFGVASAGLVAPLAHGYSGLGWGHSAFGAPAVTAYSTPIVASVAPAIATHALAAPAFTAHAVATPTISSYTAVAPVITTHAVAAPAFSTYAAAPVVSAFHATAPVVSAYHAAPAVFAGPAVFDHGFGNAAWGLDLWKKKKAAH